MNINWKMKSSIFRAVDLLHAPSVLYFAQKFVTGRSRVRINAINPVWEKHKAELASRGATGRVFEFGAGKSFSQNIYLSEVCEEQVLVDVNRMADLRLIDDAAMQLSQCHPAITYNQIRSFEDLERAYRIIYVAPCNSERTNYPDGHFDACISTNTLEHIPYESIVKIFRELKRILKRGGVICARIDYSDHYSHTDRSISPLNFLAYNDDEWAQFNHRCHFQNRLRHYDFQRLFESVGLTVEKDEPSFTARAEAPAIAKQFEADNPLVTATSGYFVLRVP